MRTVLRNTPARLPADPDALIKEARRRQRIRYLLSAVALLAMCGLGTGLYATLRGNPTTPQPPRPSPRTPHPSPAASRGPTAPRLPAIAAKVLTWPPFAVDDLRTGHYFQTDKVDLGVGDYQPLMITVGRWLVYVGHGATAVHSDLTGRSRVLGKTPFFAPSARPGAVWLEYFRGGILGNGPTRVRQVRVAGGAAGPAITLPAGTQLVAGTRAGLPLQNRDGRLRLWLGGHAMRGHWMAPGSCTRARTSHSGVTTCATAPSGLRRRHAVSTRSWRLFAQTTDGRRAAPLTSTAAGYEPGRW